MNARAANAVSLSPLVDHVVIIVKENHTYDNYFGTFPKSEGDNKLVHRPVNSLYYAPCDAAS
jgi:phospholipase C